MENDNSFEGDFQVREFYVKTNEYLVELREFSYSVGDAPLSPFASSSVELFLSYKLLHLKPRKNSRKYVSQLYVAVRVL